GAHLRRCIIDKHVVVPAGEKIGFDLARDAQRFTVSDRGVVVVGKGTIWPAAVSASGAAENARPAAKRSRPSGVSP
ncbi:MAG TPA: hypothetical protein VFY29_20150, partial [Terriglobia bacterium]|nr:hypothetical protein [Terriglobia bacterium]